MSAAAAESILSAHAHYAARGQSLAQAALAGARAFVRWAHYPDGDVIDRAQGSRFFYHAHEPQEMAQGEHGHFHVFVQAGRRDARFSHLVGISLDARGAPLRLFTTNQWVTGEFYRPADQLASVAEGFAVRTGGRLAPVARWVSAMVCFYRQAIVRLLQERDRVLAAQAADLPQALQDRRLHVTSQLPLADHWRLLEKECRT